MLKKAFKYRIYPTKEQEQYLSNLFGSCRFVYNKLLDENIQAHEKYKVSQNSEHKQGLRTFDFANRVTALKRSGQYPWLYDVCSQSLVYSAMHLADAFKGFFKHKRGYPKFKKRSNHQKASFTNQTSIIVDDALKIGKLSTPIRVVWHRPLPQTKRTGCTITKTPSGKYYASFLMDVEKTTTTGAGIVGIDLGLSQLAHFSSGLVVDNPRTYVKHQKRLARLQRKHARKQKGSKNREKSRICVALLHERVSNIRQDYLHKLTTKIISENQAVCIEDLKVKNMSRNRKLAKHILDASWGEFRRQLEYKAEYSTGCKVYVADPYYPSTQLCSGCGQRPAAKLALSVREWTCSHCGSHHGRDENASLNLLKLAIKHHPFHEGGAATTILLPSYTP